MSLEVIDRENFEKFIDKLDVLYESTKDEIKSIVSVDGDSQVSKSNALTNLHEIRNMTIKLLQEKHKINKN